LLFCFFVFCFLFFCFFTFFLDQIFFRVFNLALRLLFSPMEF
jgi:hypothetical protein